MKKLIALFCLMSTFSTILHAQAQSSDGSMTFESQKNSSKCMIKLFDGLVSVSDIEYTAADPSGIKSYNTDAIFVSREEILNSIEQNGSGQIVRETSSSEGFDQLKLTINYKNSHITGAKIKRKSAGDFFSKTTSCSLE